MKENVGRVGGSPTLQHHGGRAERSWCPQSAFRNCVGVKHPVSSNISSKSLMVQLYSDSLTFQSRRHRHTFCRKRL